MRKRLGSIVLSAILSMSMVAPVFAVEVPVDSEPIVVEKEAETLTLTEESDVSIESEVLEETGVYESVTDESIETTDCDTESEDGDVEEVMLEQDWEETGILSGDYMDNDEQFRGYVNELFGIDNDVELSSQKLGDELTGLDKVIYDKMKTEIIKVAAGERESTEFEFTREELGLKQYWTAEELGLSKITYSNLEEAYDAAKEKWRFDGSMIIRALMYDMPYELYWFDKTTTYSYGIYPASFSVNVTEDGKFNFPNEGVRITFCVSPAYSKSGTIGATETDAVKTSAPKKAAQNARQVVANNSAKSDVDKLTAYKDYICSQVSYNFEAIGESWTEGYTDPWQMVYVFDGNPATNVVCEGYSKAFQYLCDESTFTGDVDSCIVTGVMNGGTGAGDHMWNIVHMDNGKNYIVDVTNCDEGTSGYPDSLFLAGGTRYNDAKITGFGCYKAGGLNVYYNYMPADIKAYGEARLTLAADNYITHDFSKCTNATLKYEFELDSDGFAHIADCDGTIVCKVYGLCDTCNKEILITSKNFKFTSDQIKTMPTCEKAGAVKFPLVSNMNVLGRGDVKKVTLPETIIDPLGHDWGEWETTEDGESRTCKREGCNKTEVRSTKIKPTCVAPTGLAATYGDKLSSVVLTNKVGNTEGFWEWKNPDELVGDAGAYRTHAAVFTPSDKETYYSVTVDVNVYVAKADYTGNKSAEVNLPKVKGCSVIVEPADMPDGAGFSGVDYNPEDKIVAEIETGNKSIKITSGGITDSNKITVNADVTGCKNYKDYTITITVNPVDHTHAIDRDKYHEEVAPTQTADGCKAYYECANGCDKKLKEDGSEYSDMEIIIPRLDIIIALNPNGGSVDTRDIKVKYEGKYGTLPTPVRDSYYFNGWYTELNDGEKITAENIVRVTENSTLYAHWTGIETSVKFDGGLYSDIAIAYGSSLRAECKTLPEPTKEGFKFRGWYTQPNGAGEQFTIDSVVKGSVTIYPWFVKEGVFITLSANSLPYTGMAVKPEVESVVVDGRTLVAGTDYAVSYKNNIKSFVMNSQSNKDLAPTVIVTGKGNFSGIYYVYFDITPKYLSDIDVTVSEIPVALETGNAQYPVPTVMWGKIKLVNNRDYVVKYYSDSACTSEVQPKAAGTYYVRVIGRTGSNFVNYQDKIFKIEPTNKTLVSKLTVKLPKSKEYDDGKQITLSETELIVKDKVTELKKGIDYTVDYDNNVEIGTATVIITGTGDKYVGSRTVTFKINGMALSKAKMKGFVASQPYNNGNPVVQNVTFSIVEAEYLKGTEKSAYDAMSEADKRKVDYTYEYVSNTEVGKATVIYTGVNRFYGTVKKTYNITGTALKTVVVSPVESVVYNGSEYRPVVVLKEKTGKTLTLNTDYTVEYLKNENAGTAQIIITGKGAYTGTVKKTFKIAPFDVAKDNNTEFRVTLNSTEYSYAKSGAMPEPVVTFKGIPLTKGIDYTVAYINNKAVNDGTGSKRPTVKVTGKGNYKGANTSATFIVTSRDLQTGGITVTAKDKAYVDKAGNWKSSVVIAEADGKKLAAKADYSSVEYFYKEIPGGAKIFDGSQKTKPEITRVVGDKVGDKDIVPAGTTIEVVVKGNGKNKNYYGFVKGTYRIGKTDINSLKFTVDPKAYTGTEITLDESEIKWSYKGLSVNSVTFQIVPGTYKNNVKKGKATVTVIGNGDYCGTRTITFNISARSIK